MVEKLIIIASLGRVRTLEFRGLGDDPNQQEHLVEKPDRLVEMKIENLGAVVSDQSGRFSQNAPAGRRVGMSYPEDHNLESEREKQVLNSIGREIGKIVAAEGNPAWELVAPKEILPRLSRILPARARDSLVRTETGDLTKLSIKELEKRLLSRD